MNLPWTAWFKADGAVVDPQKMDPDDLVGAVCLDGSWQLFAGVIGEWVLDYQTYDPSYAAAPSRGDFRGGLLVVDVLAAQAFLNAMRPYELELDALRRFFRENASAAGDWPLSVALDFDRRVFVNGFGEVAAHRYVPSGWQGIEDDPSRYVAPMIAAIWEEA
jgi:hypothetical protein